MPRIRPHVRPPHRRGPRSRRRGVRCMKAQRDLRDPARPGCAETWNGRKWPKGFPLRGLRDPHLHHLPRSPRARRKACYVRGALVMSGYTRNTAGYAVGSLKCRKFLGSSRVLRAQTARISGGLGPNMVPPNSKRPRESPRPVADRERPVRMHTRPIFVVNSMLGKLT